MTRFRSHWLALLGGALLLALSVSSAFGAKPVGDDPNHGQQVSTFVHELLFGTDEPEEQPDEEEVDEDEVVEETDEEVLEEDVLDEEVTGAEHGACVAEAAGNHDEVGGANENHGGFVSLEARYTCWGLPLPGEEGPTGDEDLSAADDADESDAKEHGKPEKAKQNRGRGHGRGGRH